MGVTRRPGPDQRVVVAALFVATMFITIMDTTIVNVALPSIGRDLGVAADSVDEIVISYLVSLAVVIPASGWLADRFGTRRVFLVALAVFTVASGLCGLAGSVTELVLFRILQGIGGGLLTPVGMAMLFHVFPPAERARAARILVVPTVIAPAVGPVLGGVLTDQASWHWVFLVNLPIGVVTFLFGALFLTDHRRSSTGPFDTVGFVLSAGGFALLLYALSVGPTKGWTSTATLATAAVGVVATGATAWWELRHAHPLLVLRLFGNGLFRSVSLTLGVMFMAFMGVLFLIPLLMQTVRGASATTSGLVVFPEAVGVLVATQIAGRLYPTVGPRRQLMGGLVVIAAASVAMGLVDVNVSLWVLRALLFVFGFGAGFVMMPAQAAAFATIAPVQNAQASALFNALRQLAAALGVALVSTAVSLARPAGVDNGSSTAGGAFQWGFYVAAALAVLGLAVAVRVRDADAAATMGRPGAPAPAAGRAPGTGPVTDEI
ncbi:drug resistance transporter, EmrB/QacA subfamily [Frankia sp. EI5c]|uniref:DHA2 family efflux MFS transporter permease subunit n=1 Tax=Frankia sp. EI5c TaxID=683316 RepID=UPI0007C27D9A|nr:DHA2 family efflux MFS transporter permease subunit [Frankia sp. EI5c]OAA26932.1 drug resistance transporter, EmrB/QacA subfamily [Frankia sp. EI5c]